MPLEAPRQTLQELGFTIVEDRPEGLVAIARRFHWDCMLTKVTYVVFVREVDTLDVPTIEHDREALALRAQTHDPSLLPRGLQKGTAVLTAYLARHVTPEARALCEAGPKVRFAFFYIPAVLDSATGLAHFLRTTPMWGAIYFSKFRFVLGRLLEPARTPGTAWPISAFGLSILAFYVLALLAFVAVRIR